MSRDPNLTVIGRSYDDPVQDAEYEEVRHTNSILHKTWKWIKRTVMGIGILSFLIVVISIATYDSDTASSGEDDVAEQAAQEAEKAADAGKTDMADGPHGASAVMSADEQDLSRLLKVITGDGELRKQAISNDPVIGGKVPTCLANNGSTYWLLGWYDAEYPNSFLMDVDNDENPAVIGRFHFDGKNLMIYDLYSANDAGNRISPVDTNSDDFASVLNFVVTETDQGALIDDMAMVACNLHRPDAAT